MAKKKARGKQTDRRQAKPESLCSNCGRSGATAQCINCRSVLYCDRTCQKQHWKIGHKHQCKALAVAKGPATVKPYAVPKDTCVSSAAKAPRPQAPGPRNGPHSAESSAHSKNQLAHPCPICLVNEDDDVDGLTECGMCLQCGQLTCGACMGKAATSPAFVLRMARSGCPACHQPLWMDGTDADEVRSYQKLLKSKPPGRHTPKAQYLLAMYFLEQQQLMGDGTVRKDEVKAARLFKLAADKGLRRAQNNAAKCYEMGIGVPKDQLEATRLFKLAAMQGDFAACFSMASRFLYGEHGVRKDINEAARWLRQTVAANPTYDVSGAETNLIPYLTKGARVEVIGITSPEGCRLNGLTGTLVSEDQHVISEQRDAFSKEVLVDSDGDEPRTRQRTTVRIRCMNLKLLADQPSSPLEAHMMRPTAASAAPLTVPATDIPNTDTRTGTSSSPVPPEMCMTCQKVVEESLLSHVADDLGATMCFSCGRFLCLDCTNVNSRFCPACHESMLRQNDSAKLVKQLNRLLQKRKGGASHRCRAIAQYDLGCYYRDGIGVKQNYEEAVRRFRLSAGHGHSKADFDDLGRMYGTGRGVPTD